MDNLRSFFFLQKLGDDLVLLYWERQGRQNSTEENGSAQAASRTSSTREQLRRYWQHFEKAANLAREDRKKEFGPELVAGHRFTLRTLVASGELSAPAADLVHVAYESAVQHANRFEREHSQIMCYRSEPEPFYPPSSTKILTEQSQILVQIAEAGTVHPATLAKVQAALEHDIAFCALSEEEIELLRHVLGFSSGKLRSASPSLEELTQDLTPEAKEAIQFIIDLLTGK